MEQLIEGTLKNIFNREEELYKERIAVCKKCVLYKKHKVFGAICNNHLYVNPNTDETSLHPKKDFLKGCGCILRSKCRVIEAKCPINK